MKKAELKMVDGEYGQKMEPFIDDKPVCLTTDGRCAFFGWMASAATKSPKIKKEIESFLESFANDEKPAVIDYILPVS